MHLYLKRVTSLIPGSSRSFFVRDLPVKKLSLLLASYYNNLESVFSLRENVYITDLETLHIFQRKVPIFVLTRVSLKFYDSKLGQVWSGGTFREQLVTTILAKTPSSNLAS